MAISLISLFKSGSAKSRIAMTGEVTLRGRVLHVGGIKEKVLAAKRAGITTVILPKKNEKDLIRCSGEGKKRLVIQICRRSKRNIANSF
jgi:ATP-dependent Lon protease